VPGAEAAIACTSSARCGSGAEDLLPQKTGSSNIEVARQPHRLRPTPPHTDDPEGNGLCSGPLAQTGRNDRRCEFKAVGLVAV
jgi:hypothetical protein